MFTRDEVELLNEALTAWENEPSHKSFGSGLLMAMLPGRDRDEAVTEFKAESKEATQEGNARKLRCARIRAKLLDLHEQAMVKEALHGTQES